MISWALTAVFVLAALVALIARPTHWLRTLALAIVLAVVSAAVAVSRSRVTAGS